MPHLEQGEGLTSRVIDNEDFTNFCALKWNETTINPSIKAVTKLPPFKVYGKRRMVFGKVRFLPVLQILSFQLNNTIMKSFKLNELTLEQAKNHKGREYNPIEWERGILRMIKWFGDVKFYEHGDDVYAIYQAEGIRLIKRMDYISSLDNGGLKSYTIRGEELCEYAIKINKNADDIKLAKQLCGMSQDIVFASVYFNI